MDRISDYLIEDREKKGIDLRIHVNVVRREIEGNEELEDECESRIGGSEEAE